MEIQTGDEIQSSLYIGFRDFIISAPSPQDLSPRGRHKENIMKHKILTFLFSAFLLTTFFCLPRHATCEEPKQIIPDKALCAKMLATGKQAYQRGKYLDAKEYFRKAVQADPTSTVAWRYYDMAVIFGLAEKVGKNSDLIAPDVSVRGETMPGRDVPSAQPPPRTAPVKKEELKIIDDEGC
jgi:hypothetical protein